jgi:hypothetical protein
MSNGDRDDQTALSENGEREREGGSATDPGTRFAIHLAALRTAVGQPSLADLAACDPAVLKRSTLGALFRGRFVRAPRWEVVEALVSACLVLGRRPSGGLPVTVGERGSVEWWRHRHRDLVRALHAQRAGSTVRPASRPALVRNVVRNTVAATGPGTLLQIGEVHGDVHVPRGSAVPAAGEAVSGHEPLTAVRVADARPRELGVHASIGGDDGAAELPAYVARDVDARIGKLLREGAAGGCFLLLVGGSSVGKTRSLYEAVARVLPGWWLVHPGPREVGEIELLARRPVPRTVVWLDETQRYFSAESGLTDGVVRRLTGAGLIVVGTLWPDEYATGVAPRTTAREDDRHSGDRALLKLASVVDVAPAFTAVERRRAAHAASCDDRIRIALATGEPGLTQVLAAGPEMVRRWEQAASPYGRAVITAAADARRLGMRAPLTRRALADAVPGYLTSTERARAATGWFEEALAYATAPLNGAAAAVEPVDDGTVGGVAGYRIADYLLERARRTRRAVPPPESLWRSLVEHAEHPDDVERLARGAQSRMRYRFAEPLLAQLAETDGWGTASPLVDLLVQQGRAEDLRARADAGEAAAVKRLPGLLVELGRTDEAVRVLEERAARGEHAAAVELARLLVREGGEERLWSRTSGGDPIAAHHLCDLLVQRHRADEVLDVWRRCADAGDRAAAQRLASLLCEHGLADELQSRADAGDAAAAEQLTLLLLEQSTRFWERERRGGTAGARPPTAEVVVGAHDERSIEALFEDGRESALRALAASGDSFATKRLVDLLIGRGRSQEALEVVRAARGRRWTVEWRVAALAELGCLDDLREEARSGERLAAWRLVDLLVERGELSEAVEVLAARSRAGDWSAALRCADLLVEDGRTAAAAAVLAERADAGDRCAAQKLARLLADRGDVDRLRERADGGDCFAGWRLAGILADTTRTEELRRRAAGGGHGALHRLVTSLVDRGEVDEAVGFLRSRAEAEDCSASEYLAHLLVEHDRVDDLEERSDGGDGFAAWRLAQLFVERGRTADLRRRAEAGYEPAARWLTRLLLEQDRVDEVVDVLRFRADAGSGAAAEQLVTLLVDRGRAEDLRTEVDAGTPGAADELIALLLRQGRVDAAGAGELRRRGLDADGSFPSRTR